MKTWMPWCRKSSDFSVARHPGALVILLTCVLSAGCTTATPNAHRALSSAPLERQLEKQHLRITAIEQQLASMSAAQRNLEERYAEAMQRVDTAMNEMHTLQNSVQANRNGDNGSVLMRQPDAGGEKISAAGVAADTKTPTAVYREAFAAYTTGKHALATKLFEQFATSFPDNIFVANARFWQGEAFLAQGLHVEAMEAFTAVEAFDPHSPKVPFAHLKQAMIRQRQGDMDAARSLLEEIWRQYPDTDAARQAKAALESGDF